MKLEVEKHIIKEDDTITYKIIAVTKCCDEILDEDYIVLGADIWGEKYGFSLLNKQYSYTDDDYVEGIDYKPIKYCPFCGKPLKVIIGDTVDKTEDYNKLYDKKYNLRRLYNITKREELSKQLNELSHTILKFQESDGMEELIRFKSSN